MSFGPNMTSNQEVPQAGSVEMNRLIESIKMAGRTSHRLVQLFVNTAHPVNFTEEQKQAPEELYVKMRNSVLAITPLCEYREFMRSIQHRTVENKIMDCLAKVLAHVTNYMLRREGCIREATNWFNLTNTIYQHHVRENPITAFFFVQGAYVDLVKYHDHVRAMGNAGAAHRELVEDLATQHLIPEMQHRPFTSEPIWHARKVIRSWLAKVRQFEFQCEMLATQYNMMLVQSLIGFWQNANGTVL